MSAETLKRSFRCVNTGGENPPGASSSSSGCGARKRNAWGNALGICDRRAGLLHDLRRVCMRLAPQRIERNLTRAPVGCVRRSGDSISVEKHQIRAWIDSERQFFTPPGSEDDDQSVPRGRASPSDQPSARTEGEASLPLQRPPPFRTLGCTRRPAVAPRVHNTSGCNLER